MEKSARPAFQPHESSGPRVASALNSF